MSVGISLVIVQWAYSSRDVPSGLRVKHVNTITVKEKTLINYKKDLLHCQSPLKITHSISKPFYPYIKLCIVFALVPAFHHYLQPSVPSYLPAKPQTFGVSYELCGMCVRINKESRRNYT